MAENYSFIALAGASLDDMFIFLNDYFARYTPQQQVRAVVKMLEQVTRLVPHPVSDEWYMAQAGVKDPEKYVAGRYVLHAVDIFVCNLLSFAAKNHLAPACREQMSPAVLELLRGAMANSVRILACEDFFYSIGAVRFSRSQSLLTMYDRLFLQAPSVLKRALFALQACVLFGLGDEMLAHAFTVLAQNVRVRVDDNGEEAAVGIHLMLSYFVMLLLSLCYDRGYVVHTLKVGEEEVCDVQDAIYNDVLLALLSVEDQTAEKDAQRGVRAREHGLLHGGADEGGGLALRHGRHGEGVPAQEGVPGRRVRVPGQRRADGHHQAHRGASPVPGLWVVPEESPQSQRLHHAVAAAEERPHPVSVLLWCDG